MREINVFDFDDTIYNGDSSIDFYLFCLIENIFLIRYLPVQIYGMLMYKLKRKPKEYFKEEFFSFLKGIKDIDKKIQKFWRKNSKKINKQILYDKTNIVIISASPRFLLEPICNELNIEKLIATEVESKTGKFISKNCYGKEKINRLNKEYDNYTINEFYSDSKSDIYLAENAQKSFLVKKDKIDKWNL